MEIHKPKPVHSWRELLTEIGVIVIGVAIALAAEQGVDWLHWQHRVADARSRMLLELRNDDGPQAYTRVAAATCFDQQLDGIQGAIEGGRSRDEITAIASRYAPPLRTWDSTAWDSMIASDVASHVTSEQMSNWGMIYDLFPRMNARSEQERESLVALRPIRGGAEKPSSSEADTMLAAVAQLRAINRNFAIGAVSVLQKMQINGITVTPEQRAHILGGLRSLYGDCVIVPSTPSLNTGDQLFSMRRAMQQGPQ